MASDLRVNGSSIRGKRDNNEDAFGIGQVDGVRLFVVADGLGGHPDGDKASELTVKVALDLFQLSPTRMLEELFSGAHLAVKRWARSQGHSTLRGPGSTLVVARTVKGSPIVEVGWCGDSGVLFAYKSSNDVVHLTNAHGSGSSLWRYIGGPNPNPEFRFYTPRGPGRLVLYSDGMNCLLDRRDVTDQRWKSTASPGDADPSTIRWLLQGSAVTRAAALPHKAVATGSTDNCTVVVVPIKP